MDPTKMASVVITLKIMPIAPETDLNSLKEQAKKVISSQGGEVGKEEFEPVAFGLKAIKLIFVRDESRGGTDEIEAQISQIEGVNSVEVADVRRAIG